MIVLWDWEPDYLAALRTAGLLSPADGVKLRQGPLPGARDKFNEQMAPGSELREWVFANDRPFAVDRGVGGTNYDPYPWDKDVLRAVAERLADKFLGVQIHEWIGNVASDVRRIREHGLDGVVAGPYGGRPGNAGGRPRLQYGMKEHYAGRAMPSAASGFLALADDAFRRKQDDFGGYGYLVEGNDQSFARAFGLGARAGFAEVGRQVPLASLQVACLRGAARPLGKPWGLYYEPWASGACTHYSTRSLWGRPKALTFHDRALGHGGHFGSSRALQRRLLYYGLICGAHFVADEYGYENMFWNPPNPALTPYGLVQKEAIELGRERDFGESWRPILIVVADEHWPLRTRDVLDGAFSGWGTCDVEQPGSPVLATLQRCFLGAEPSSRFAGMDPHEEWRTLPPSELPDVFDVVPASLAAAAGDYELTVYCGGRRVEAEQVGQGAREFVWADEVGPEGVSGAVAEFLRAHAPTSVDGDVFVTLNKLSDSWLLGLFNPFGVSRSPARGDEGDSRQTQHADVDMAGISVVEEWASRSDYEPPRVEGRRLRVAIPPGGVRLLEVRLDHQGRHLDHQGHRPHMQRELPDDHAVFRGAGQPEDASAAGSRPGGSAPARKR